MEGAKARCRASLTSSVPCGDACAPLTIRPRPVSDKAPVYDNVYPVFRRRLNIASLVRLIDKRRLRWQRDEACPSALANPSHEPAVSA